MLKKATAATGLVIAALGGALLMTSPASAGGFGGPARPPGDLNVNSNNLENSNTSNNSNSNTNTASVESSLV
jgi:hypothetical protein